MANQEPTAKDLFLASLRCDSRQRATFLAERCGENSELLRRIQDLLSAHAVEQPLIDIPLVPSLADFVPRIVEGPGTIIGSYKLLELIGEGGFGLVFMADQLRPVKRRVALKVVKPGMDTRQVVARFESERQALALMDHPHIARIFDGGMTHSGRPYFVMELVHGTPITTYCEQHGLEIRRRLELFSDVCRAIEHAHQRGVIHRDIKPHNILITVHDEVPFVKVIDFGIAKAIGQDLTDKTLFTRFAGMLGTPLYMSPEQATNSLDIDTRTDIYSLGAVLYEMLTGTTPVGHERVQETSLEDVLRMLREVEPLPPSRLATIRRNALTVETPSSSVRISALPPLFRKELDWVVMKAMEKDRNRRYPTVDALARDVQRYLDDKPLEARPPSPLYRWKKFIKRHMLAVASGTVALLSLVTLIVVLSVAAQRLRSELKRVERAETAERAANQEALSRLWLSYVNEAHAKHESRKSGQRFGTLRAIQNALQLPTPNGQSRDSLRTEAIAALCLPDLEVARSVPHASRRFQFALDGRLQLLGVDDANATQFVVRDLASGQDRMRLPFADWNANWEGPVFSPDSQILVYPQFVDGAPRVHLWRVGVDYPIADLGPETVCVTFRPDSQLCAVSYTGGRIRILDCRTMTEVRGLETGLIAPSIAWNPQFPQIVALDRSRWRVLDVVSGQPLCEHVVDEQLDGWPDWDPSGTRIAAGVRDLNIGIWDSRTGELTVKPIVGHRQRGVVVRFSPSGSRLVSNDWSRLIRLWDSRTGQQLLTVPAAGLKLQFSQDGRFFGADCAADQLTTFRYHGGEEFQTIADLPQSESRFVVAHHVPCLNRTGRILAIREEDANVLIDTHSNEVICRMSIGANGPFRFDNGPEGEMLWTYGQAGLLSWPIQLDEQTGKLTVGPSQRLASIAREECWGASADGGVVLVPQQNGATLWSRQTQQSWVLPEANDVRSAVVAPDGTLGVMGVHSYAGTSATIWDLTARTKVAELDVGAGTGVFMSPDGKWLVTDGGGTRIYRVGDWQHFRKLSVNTARPCFSHDSRLLAISDEFGIVRLFCPETARELAVLTSPRATRLVPVAFTLDGGKLFAVGQDDNAMHVFDLHAIRRQLAEMGLDWEAPPLSAGAAPNPSSSHTLKASVILGDFSDLGESSPLAKMGRNP